MSRPVIADIIIHGDVFCQEHLFQQEIVASFFCDVLLETGKKLGAQAHVNVVVMTDVAIAEYNHQYRQKNSATNVLAFPTVEKNELWPVLPNQPILLGDILMGWETVIQEAKEQNKALEHHVMHLLAHGFLHLLHYDHEHELEAQEMEGLERAVFRSLGWPDPYGGEDNSTHSGTV